MSVKLKVLSAGALFFIGGAVMNAQKTKKDTLKETKIEDVVILGYSKTATKPKNVTASTTVTAEKFEGRPTTSFLNSLQGESPGVSINANSGSPGSGKINVIIRGVSSINAGSEPLYVIDGMISNAVQFRNLNDNDIESASVLRDAAATSVYGNRASNGVIVITTKRGKFSSPLKVNYSGITGINVLPNLNQDLTNSKELLTLEKRYGQGLGATLTESEIADYAVDTDWRKVFFRTGIMQRHDLSFAVGGENVNLYSSIGYLNSQGVVPVSDFSRYTFRNNVNGRSSNRKFAYSVQSALSYSKRNELLQEANSSLNNNSIQNPLLGAPQALPYLKSGQYATGQDLYNAIGTDFSGGKTVYVLEDILKGNVPTRRYETGILLNGDVSYKLTDKLTLGNKSGVDYKYYENILARAPWSFLAIAVAKNTAVEGVVDNPYGGTETIAKLRQFDFNSITRLTYDTRIGDSHTLSAGVYLDYLKSHFASTTQDKVGLNPRNWVFGAGTGYVTPLYIDNPSGGDPLTFYLPTISAETLRVGTLAYFASVDYDYAGKYGFQGLVRRDGSYRFTEDNRWATFWSVAGRWNVDREDFMRGSAFKMLKLRASYGTQGNQNIITGSIYNPLYSGVNLIREVYAIGTGYDNASGAIGFGGLKNPLAQWEVVAQANIGIDFNIKNRLSGSFDVYDKRTSDLYSYINISGVTGSYGIAGNNGKLQNRGFEAMLKYEVIARPELKVSLYANASYNKSKILELLKDDNSGTTRNVVGGMLSEYYFAPYVGVNPANGNLLFLNKDGDVTESIDTNDLVATGKNYLPKWQGGFGLNAEYKGFYLNSHFSFQQGAWKYDGMQDWLMRPEYIGKSNQNRDMLNAWTATNVNTDVPSLTAHNHSIGRDYSDRFLKDASFIRLKNVSVGYNIPSRLLSSTGVRSVKVFVSGENVLTWTKWKGYDPEVSSSISVYPNMKTYSLGVNVDF